MRNLLNLNKTIKILHHIFLFSRKLVVFYSPSFLLNNFFSFCSALPLQASLVILGHLLIVRLSFLSVEMLSMFLQFVEIFEFIDKTWKLSSIALPFRSLRFKARPWRGEPWTLFGINSLSIGEYWFLWTYNQGSMFRIGQKITWLCKCEKIIGW